MPQISKPSIVDVEASGFGSESYPIEVGVVTASGEKYCTLIKPLDSWTHWDARAQDVHHISRQTLRDHGKPVYEVAEQLNNLLAGSVLYSDGWVVDKPWLTTLFYAAGKSMRFSVSPLEMILSEAQMAVWHLTKEHILQELKLPRHRASNDAWVVQETYRRTLTDTAGQQVHSG